MSVCNKVNFGVSKKMCKDKGTGNIVQFWIINNFSDSGSICIIYVRCI